MEKLPCRICGKKVLPATLEKTGGLCMPCYKGPNRKGFWDRAEELAVRLGVMKDTDRTAGLPLAGHDESGYAPGAESSGTSVAEILRNRLKEDDYILVGQLVELLMEKENTQGFESFSKAEASVYLAGDMIRQLDSGGFGTYFYNTGHLAGSLLESLDEISAKECRELVSQAISVYGKVPANDYDQMLEELAKITGDFDENPWEHLDDRYYELDENLGQLIMDYVHANQAHFSQ